VEASSIQDQKGNNSSATRRQPRNGVFGHFWTGFGIGIGVLGIILAIFLWALVPCSPPELPKAQIIALHFDSSEVTNFQPGMKAPGILTIVGESIDVPSEWSIWICVFPIQTGRYYPQREPVKNHGMWELEGVCLGEDKSTDIGKTFVINLVVADADATKQLYEYAQHIFTGLETLPDGAVICDQVVVVRNQ